LADSWAAESVTVGTALAEQGAAFPRKVSINFVRIRRCRKLHNPAFDSFEAVKVKRVRRRAHGQCGADIPLSNPIVVTVPVQNNPSRAFWFQREGRSAVPIVWSALVSMWKYAL
jgi:hypothetical protein